MGESLRRRLNALQSMSNCVRIEPSYQPSVPSKIPIRFFYNSAKDGRRPQQILKPHLPPGPESHHIPFLYQQETCKEHEKARPQEGADGRV